VHLSVSLNRRPGFSAVDLLVDDRTVTIAVGNESTTELQLHAFDLADGSPLYEQTLHLEQRDSSFSLLPLEGRLCVLGYGQRNEVVVSCLD